MKQTSNDKDGGNFAGPSFDNLTTLEQSIIVLEKILFEGVTEEKDLIRLFKNDYGRTKGLLLFLEEMGWIRDCDCRGRYEVSDRGKQALGMHSRWQTKKVNGN